MIIDPTEKRDQHCKIYVESSVKKQINDYATKQGYTFSEAGRQLLIDGLQYRGM